jgi:hypothetical protein
MEPCLDVSPILQQYVDYFLISAKNQAKVQTASALRNKKCRVSFRQRIQVQGTESLTDNY